MAHSQIPKSNIPEFSVTELALSLKKTLEDQYGRVRVRGELSRITIASSGHMYSSLKEDQAVIDAICWRGVMSKLSVKPEEGLEVICTGRISTFPARSNYQLIIESMELAGEGALLKMLEERKKKLAAEGLFDADRKKPIPFLPDVIGVVTSPTGAVIRDILHRLADRFPRRVLLWPVKVQGEAAAEQVAEAIRQFQDTERHGLPRPDVIIVARGGGSLEDLMAFNEEVVVRAIAESAIPVISAIGHETDTTLADFASDLRAPTPTGAAEMAVPMRAHLQAQVLDNEKRLINALQRLLSESSKQIDNLHARLQRPEKLLEAHMQKLDFLHDKLSRTFSHYLVAKRAALKETTAALYHPRGQLEQGQRNLERWAEQLKRLPVILFKDRQTRLNHSAQMLQSLSFENILARGFTVIQDENGRLIKKAEDTRPGQAITIRFQEDKSVAAHTDTETKGKKPAVSRQPKKTADEQQPSLF